VYKNQQQQQHKFFLMRKVLCFFNNCCAVIADISQILFSCCYSSFNFKLHSYSFYLDDVIPAQNMGDIADGRATYVIRKGRRRQRIDEFGSASMSSINSKLSNEGLCSDSNVALNVPSPIYPPSMMTPNSRHSIDLGASPRKHALHHQHNYHHHPVASVALNSPRFVLNGSIIFFYR
jgi:hypothetical protein